MWCPERATEVEVLGEAPVGEEAEHRAVGPLRVAEAVERREVGADLEAHVERGGGELVAEEVADQDLRPCRCAVHEQDGGKEDRGGAGRAHGREATGATPDCIACTVLDARARANGRCTP